MLFQLSYKRFLEEIRFERIGQDSKNNIELEDLGDKFAYYLIPLERQQSFVFVVLKSELTAVQKIMLNPISKPSKRVIDSTLTKSVNEVTLKIDETDDKKKLVDYLKRKYNPT